jgi:hypothetical protein
MGGAPLVTGRDAPTRVQGPLDATKVDAMRPLLPRQPPAPAVPVPGRARVTNPAGGPAPKRVDRRRTAIVVGTVILLVVLVLVLIPLLRGNDDARPRSAGSPSANKPTSQAAQPSATQPSGGAPATTAPPSGGSGSGTGTTAKVPAGWHRYQGPGGFVVYVPFDYTTRRDGTMVYFDEKNGSRLLGIDQSDTPKSDPVKDWQRQAAYRSGQGDWDDYHQIKIVHVDYFRTAADWEWTYNNGGTRTHVVNRGFVTGKKQAHAIYWSTPESQWNANYATFQLIAQTFRPNPA